MVIYNGELYVSDPVTNLIKVYNASTMSQTPVRSFSIANVGLLDFDRQGFIWMLDTVQKKLIRFSATGEIQSQSITFPSGIVPTSFCVDKTNDRILVTNNGDDQNVLIYTGIFGTPSQTSTFGNLGGINSGTAGAIAPLKFSEPKGVGIDSSGNIFVANNGVTTARSSPPTAALIRLMRPSSTPTSISSSSIWATRRRAANGRWQPRPSTRSSIPMICV